MAEWNNTNGGIWSVSGNWLGGAPTDGDFVSFPVNFTFTSVMDANWLPLVNSPTLSDVGLVPGVTLDVQRNVTVAEIDNLATNSAASNGGLIEIGNGATLNFTDFGIYENTVAYVQGDGVGAEGTFFLNAQVNVSGTLTLNGVNFDTNSIEYSGGSASALITLENGSTYTARASESFNQGTVSLAGGGVANFGAVTASGSLTNTGSVAAQLVKMSGSNNELVLPNTSAGTVMAVSGFGATDKIELSGVTTVQSATYSSGHLNFFSSADGSGSALAVLSGVTLAAGLSSTLGVSKFTIGTDTTGTFVELVSCFTPGTRISTTEGEVRVEDLREGDMVMTQTEAGAEPRAVIWIGHRKLDLTRHPYPWMAAPIRIRAGAFADNVPKRDLLLSPDHAIFVGGGLVPAKLLVNDATILRENPDSVEYFHVECESHAIIMAEGLTVETYLDTGNRAMFDNAGVALLLHPQFQINSAAKCWDAACAPLLTDTAAVEPIWRGLLHRALWLGYHPAPAPEMTGDPCIRLVARGRELRPISSNNGRHVFALPWGVSEVTLLSRNMCAAEGRAWADDQRQLGVAVREIVFRNGEHMQTLGADHPGLRRGWWKAETDGTTHWRWTDGAGIIALPFPARLIEVDVAMTALYPVEPAATERWAA